MCPMSVCDASHTSRTNATTMKKITQIVRLRLSWVTFNRIVILALLANVAAVSAACGGSSAKSQTQTQGTSTTPERSTRSPPA